ncbi:hypothetical protein GF352_00620 [archaeon]|nr:hypothetical protein [archaeon]
MNVHVIYNENPLEAVNQFAGKLKGPKLINAQEEDAYLKYFKNSVLINLNSTNKVPVSTSYVRALLVGQGLTVRDYGAGLDLKPATSSISELSLYNHSLEDAFTEAFDNDLSLLVRNPSYFADLAIDCNPFLYSLTEGFPDKRFFANENTFILFEFFCKDIDKLSFEFKRLEDFIRILC